MTITARQSTARTLMAGPVLDANGAAVTTAVVGDLKISKNGGIPAALNASATLTHRHTGHYSLALTATDLDTVGTAQITLDKTTDTCPEKDITVIEEAVYDALFAESAVGYVANQPVDVNTIKTQAITCSAAVTVSPFVGNATAAIGVNASGHVSRVVLADTVTNLTNLPAITANWLTAAGMAPDASEEIRNAITGGAYALSTDANGRIRIVDGTGAGELDTLSGTVLLRSATQASIDAIEADTNELQTDWANGGRLDLLLDLAAATLTAAGVRTAVGLASANLDTQLTTIDDLLDTEIASLQTSINALFTTALTQSYRAVGAAPTLAQCQFEMLAHLGDCAISGTTKTLNNLAGTAAKTFTLNSAVTPTSITETT